MPESNPVGRPLKFESVELLEAKIEAYFRECDREEDTRIYEHGPTIQDDYEDLDKEGKRVSKTRLVCERCHQNPAWSQGCILISGELKRKKPYTVTGLAVWLDTSRQTLNNYEIRPEFFDSIKREKQRVENYAAEKLYDKDAPTRGVIFSLSNNSEDWSEKKSTDMTLREDSAKKLAARVFDDEDDEEETATDETVEDQPPTTADAEKTDLADPETKAVSEDQQSTQALHRVV